MEEHKGKPQQNQAAKHKISNLKSQINFPLISFLIISSISPRFSNGTELIRLIYYQNPMLINFSF